ncbi:MAG TPA: hypothetical protein VGD53_26905 [Actinoallomurus sp.]
MARLIDAPVADEHEIEAVADYVENIRPKFGCAEHPALWVTERGRRIKPAEINARFVAYRDALGLRSVLIAIGTPPRAEHLGPAETLDRPHEGLDQLRHRRQPTANPAPI